MRVVVEAEVEVCAVDVAAEVDACTADVDAEVEGSSVRTDEDEEACGCGTSSPTISTFISSASRPPRPCPGTATGGNTTGSVARMIQARSRPSATSNGWPTKCTNQFGAPAYAYPFVGARRYTPVGVMVLE